VLQARKDEQLTLEAKQKVGQAKLSVADASKQVQRAMDDVTGILRELEGLQDIGKYTPPPLNRNNSLSCMEVILF